MKRYFRAIFGQVKAQQKIFVRDKVALFFTFLLPLIFLFVFGMIFNNQSVNFKVAIINHSEQQFAKEFVERSKKDEDSPLKIVDVSNIDEAKQKMKRSEIDGIIELPESFGVAGSDGRPSGELSVLYQKGSDQAGQTLMAIMSQTINGINKSMGQPDPPLSVKSQAVGDQALKQFDYTFTGLLAFSIMSMGIFGLANNMPSEKQKGWYRRLRAAPFTSSQMIIATSIHYTIIGLLSVLMMVVVGLFVFNFTVRGDWLIFWLFALLSSVSMIGFGLLIGAWAKNERQSAPLTNLVSFPMMFLSGAFFPSFLFPEWLQTVGQFIPLTPIVDGFRMIMTENASLINLGPQLGMVATWTIVVYVAAIKLFRWE